MESVEVQTQLMGNPVDFGEQSNARLFHDAKISFFFETFSSNFSKHISSPAPLLLHCDWRIRARTYTEW